MGYKSDERMPTITATDPKYCMDSVSPGSFRCWASALTGLMIESFNTMTLEEDASSVRENCQKQAEEIIRNEYGY